MTISSLKLCNSSKRLDSSFSWYSLICCWIPGTDLDFIGFDQKLFKLDEVAKEKIFEKDLFISDGGITDLIPPAAMHFDSSDFGIPTFLSSDAMLFI